mgnify:CR=1 FL=1
MAKFVKIREGFADEFSIDIEDVFALKRIPPVNDIRYLYLEVHSRHGGVVTIGCGPNTNATKEIYAEINNHLFNPNK